MKILLAEFYFIYLLILRFDRTNLKNKSQIDEIKIK